MERIRTMLVEDEKLVLQDILTIIDWETAGFSIVATAVNGKQGLTKFKETCPQLIITDIRMPVMDGLAMLSEIRKKNSQVMVLLLSAYEDFSYAKQAIRLDVEDYLIKAELTPTLIRQKLAAIRTQFCEKAAKDINSAKAKLQDFINSPVHQPADLPDQLLKKLSFYDKTWAYTQLAQYLNETFKTCYRKIGFPERFQATPARNLPSLMNWVSAEAENLRILQKTDIGKPLPSCVTNALEYIHHHFRDPDLQISAIASAVGLSSGRLSVLFRQELNKTVNEVITDVRIEAAKKLILKGGYKVYEIANMVGYKTSHYFSQVFYQHTGQQPNKYRREEMS